MNPHSNPRFTFAPKSEGAFLPRAGPTAAQHFANARWKLSPALLARGFVPSGNQVENWGSPPHPEYGGNRGRSWDPALLSLPPL